MKTAKKQITGVELTCPYCDAIIPAPGGSHIWDVLELGKTLACVECSKTSKTPKGL